MPARPTHDADGQPRKSFYSHRLIEREISEMLGTTTSITTRNAETALRTSAEPNEPIHLHRRRGLTL